MDGRADSTARPAVLRRPLLLASACCSAHRASSAASVCSVCAWLRGTSKPWRGSSVEVTTGPVLGTEMVTGRPLGAILNHPLEYTMRDEGEFGRLLHQLRRERDLTQEDLGQGLWNRQWTMR